MADASIRRDEIDPATLKMLGYRVLAYVKPAEIEGVAGYAIHGADGAAIGFAPSEAHAVMAIRENGMQPVRLH